MLGVELSPTAYHVEAIETPLDGYIWGTVKNTGTTPIPVLVGWSGAVGDRYPIEDPQKWLSELLSADRTSAAARTFFLNNGIIDRAAISHAPKDLPRGVRDYWKKAGKSKATPFAVRVQAFLSAKDKAEARIDLANRALQNDLSGRIARSELIGALVNHGLKEIGIGVYEGAKGALTAYADPSTMDQAIDLFILDYYAKPDIVKCASCKTLFRRIKDTQRFCTKRCKNLYHVRKYRAAV